MTELDFSMCPQGRRSTRVMSKGRASLVINLDLKPKRVPCLVLDSSKEGFRLRGSFDLKVHRLITQACAALLPPNP
jgi:hypothetical protein